MCAVPMKRFPPLTLVFSLAEKDWTDDDRAREKVLMQELMTLIEQRDAIVNCLDEDRQRCHTWDPVGGAASW